MLRYMILSSEAGESLLAWIEVCAWVIEILAVVIIVVAIFTSMAFYL